MKVCDMTFYSQFEARGFLYIFLAYNIFLSKLKQVHNEANTVLISKLKAMQNI